MLMVMELMIWAAGLVLVTGATLVALGAYGMARAYSQEFREENQASKQALRMKNPPRHRKPKAKAKPMQGALAA